MHYYKRHIGDYVKKTAHLSPLEHGIYNLILDSYYDREQAPTLLEATRWARARTDDEKNAVLGILDEFFTFCEDERYHQQRVDDELLAYQKKADRNREVGQLGGRPKTQTETQTVSNKTQTITQTEPKENPNHKPLTTNQEPTKKHKPPAIADAELFPGVSSQIVDDFKALRRAKKSAITPTAMKAIIAEAEKAGLTLEGALQICCARGWQGFKAEWVTQSAPQRSNGSSNLHVNNLDHSSSKRAMEENMRRHGITEIPEGEITF